MPGDTDSILSALRDATRATLYDGRLYLVGGFVRDKVMGLPSPQDDIDIVLEGDALGLAQFLYDRGVAQYHPVVYPRFGTAMIVVQGRDVELVTARVESYAPDSRRPDQVRPGTLADDARRRDFTINTLLENLHTGEIADPLGLAYQDLEARIIRTPTDPALTFADDPLRMLRAVRFAARFGFAIAPETWGAMRIHARRLQIVSAERIQEEFSKTLLTPRAPRGLELLRDSGLLAQFAPELLEMVGVTQNAFHAYDVWTHTLIALGSLPLDASLTLRLATLLHDVAKPRTRTVDAEGHVHFYGHQDVGAQMARALMQRLKFSNDEIAGVTRLVAQHMRIGEYHSGWTDAAVRRLIRDLGPCLDDLFALHRADVAAQSPERQDISRALELRARIDAIQSRQDITALTSPLDGQEIMTLLNLSPGKQVGRIKDYLTNEVVEGRLAPDDKETAARLAREFLDRQDSE
ncbi:MAG: HD domain-containing protein [Armatimonadetes bacterium]|nr:HD domain-containing protein [Armatimonadota bacterium]